MSFEAILINPDGLPDYIQVGTDIRRGKPYAMDSVNTGYEDVGSGIIMLDNGAPYHLVGCAKPRGNNAFIVRRVYITDDSETDPVLKVWGRYGDLDAWYKRDKRLQDWLQEQVTNTSPNTYKEQHEFRYTWRLRAFQPFRSEKFEGKISLYPSLKDRDNEREVAMKPTRAFALMFPEIPHKELITMCDSYLNEFVERNFTVYIGCSKEDFTFAYNGDQAPMENIKTTNSHKSMGCSCMRYDFEDLPMHPAAAYASGDFKIIYTKDENNLVGSRCVVRVDGGKWHAGPIYGTTEQSIQMIHHELSRQDKDYTIDQHGSWIGARLLAKEFRGGFVAPYLDLSPQSLDETGNGYLVIDNCGGIDASDYSGVLNSRASCYQCGDICCEDEERYSEYNGNTYCSDCFYEEHFYCEHIGEDCHIDESVEVWYESASGYDYERYHQSIVDDGEAVECSDGKLWTQEDTHYCESEDQYISAKDTENYFRSDWDDQMYHIDKGARLSDTGRLVSIDEAKESGYILNEKTCEWEKGDDE